MHLCNIAPKTSLGGNKLRCTTTSPVWLHWEFIPIEKWAAKVISKHILLTFSINEDIHGTLRCYLINHSNLIPFASQCVKDNKGNHFCDDCIGEQKQIKKKHSSVCTMGPNITDQNLLITFLPNIIQLKHKLFFSLYFHSQRRFVRLNLALK